MEIIKAASADKARLDKIEADKQKALDKIEADKQRELDRIEDEKQAKLVEERRIQREKEQAEKE